MGMPIAEALLILERLAEQLKKEQLKSDNAS
jgi:hypothetical protein